MSPDTIQDHVDDSDPIDIMQVRPLPLATLKEKISTDHTQNLYTPPNLPDRPPLEIIAQVRAVLDESDEDLLKQLCVYRHDLYTNSHKSSLERKPYLWGLFSNKELLTTKLYSLNRDFDAKGRSAELRVLVAQSASMDQPAIVGRPSGRLHMQYCLWLNGEFDDKNGLVVKYKEGKSVSKVAAGWKGKKRKIDAVDNITQEGLGQSNPTPSVHMLTL